jgi:hypothetical protein
VTRATYEPAVEEHRPAGRCHALEVQPGDAQRLMEERGHIYPRQAIASISTLLGNDPPAGFLDHGIPAPA